MATTNYYACDLRTGLVVAELPLVNVSGAVSLTGTGEMNADLPLTFLSTSARIEMLFATTPGRASIVLDRDGKIAGEWIVWKRSRGNDFAPVKLIGAEVPTFLDRQLMTADTFSGAEQINIATTLARRGFWVDGVQGRAGSLRIDIPDGDPSGVTRDRTYEDADGTVGQRLQELSSVDNGFDYTVTSEWGDDGDQRVVRRTFHTHYPQAGLDQPWVLDQASTRYGIDDSEPFVPGQGGVVVGLSLDEDATGIGSVAYAIGSGEGTEKIIGRKTSTALTKAGYPRMMVSRSFTSVINQSVIDSHAAALLELIQDPTLPPTVSILADGDPNIADFTVGDRCHVSVDPSVNFPLGYVGMVRVLGWTYNSPAEGVEIVDLEIAGIADDLGGDE